MAGLNKGHRFLCSYKTTSLLGSLATAPRVSLSPMPQTSYDLLMTKKVALIRIAYPLFPNGLSGLYPLQLAALYLHHHHNSIAPVTLLQDKFLHIFLDIFQSDLLLFN